jgi:hypothetical protein
MNNIKAFPTLKGDIGMDLRDYFAAKAMQGILLNEASDDPLGEPLFVTENPSVYESALEIYSTAAYRMADAMMKARNK